MFFNQLKNKVIKNIWSTIQRLGGSELPQETFSKIKRYDAIGL